MKKTEKKEIKSMDVVFILDRSGSMSGSESDTIGGYNSYIKENKDKNYNVSTILFDGMVDYLYQNVAIKDVKKLTNKEYQPRGCTALYDGIGEAITYLDSKKSKKAIIIITTDGCENASRKYNKEQIKEMIEGHKNYEVLYIGANIDSYAEGNNIGIKKDNISNFKKDKKGIGSVFKAASIACDEMFECDCIGTSWKNDLENYINTNKE